MNTGSNDSEIVSTRLISAAPELVFKAYCDPERLAKWWGPSGFTNTFHAFDFRPGGIWHYDMYGPDGTVYENTSRFEEITPQYIVLQHLEPVHAFRMTMTLEEEHGQTRLTWRMLFESAEECARVRPYVPRCNEENLDRLESELENMKTTGAGLYELTLTRIIDAPPEKVYNAWTDPALIVQWFTPPPFVTISAALDVRPGGSCLITMRGPDGNETPCPGVYLEVIEHEKLVFTDAYVKAWEPSAKPFMTTILTFENLNGKTRYTARVLHWSAADKETHEEMGFHQGWGIATDQLATLVTKPN